MKRIAASLLILAMVATNCRKIAPDKKPDDNPPPSPEKVLPAGVYTLPVIETTDMHGHLVETDGDVVHYRLAYIADKVAEARAGEDDHLLLLDSGDLYQGASVSNLTNGWPIYVSVDKMGYDAVALGNHEFDWGVENMVEADATLPDYDWEGSHCVNEVPVLCANLYRDGERVPYTKDYVIVEKTATDANGNEVPVKIGIVGFAENYAGSIMTTLFTGRSFSITEDYSIANDIAKELEESGRCDATILLVHGAADAVAQNVGPASPFDLVVGGHSHQGKAGRTERGLAYIQGGRYCERYAYADLRFMVESDGSISFQRADNLSTPLVNATLDRYGAAGQKASALAAEIIAVSDDAIARTAEVQNEVIGYINVSATSYYLNASGGRATLMGNWMCDILRRIGEADVAFVNSGGVRTTFPLNGAATRDITVANVYEIFPFNNIVYVYDLSYAELLQVFEYSMTSGGRSLYTYMTGLDCRYTVTDYGEYTTSEVYSLSKDGVVIYQAGKWTGDWADRRVTLAVSEYVATTARTDYYTNLPNPLIVWNLTSRLISSDMVDNENAIRVLRAEAAASGGLLSIDLDTHFTVR